MTFALRAVNLAALNSMTKYPSIPTYHRLDPSNGNLSEPTVPLHGQVIVTEKIDGTNGRIISLPDGSYLIGSREELLYAQGDLLANPAHGIVAALKPIADRMEHATHDSIRVHYLEVYGGSIGKMARQYTGGNRVAVTMFDCAAIDDYADLLSWPIERVSTWRDTAGQHFLDEDELTDEARQHGLDLVPRLFTIDATALPTTIADARAWLSTTLPRTLVALDNGAGLQPEGVVLRTADRRLIAKARNQDYVRTLRRTTR
ncbi:RNA ligase family protein [Kutzneria sp. 744]|uniref:RNA ligase family protein n=1 Tax=Kutzneria sp. (strain 744) TaxID=345341 RepID=UPI0003EECD32|nr:RNA ligase family protein [Kutzneria sp. 744]EWM19709.1 mucin-5AC [Kutzneria sp. 744]